MKQNTSLMEFPCEFMLKVMGLNTKAFKAGILKITRKHFPDTKASAVKSNPSRDGNYLALSITILVKDQPTLDLLYHDLTKHPDVKMVL